MSILILVEHEAGDIRPATLNVVTAGVKIGGDIHLLVAGNEVAGVAEKAAKIPGVTKVMVADDPAYTHELAENLSALVIKHAGGYSHILFAATAAGKNVMPRVAALLDVSGISDIIEVKSDDTFVRPIYAGNALATVKSADSVKVIGVRTTSFDSAESEGGSATVESVDSTESSALVSFVGQELSQSDRPELTSAEIVVSGGRGMQNGDNFSMLDDIAGKLNAAVGASRAAVDAGFVPNEYQVGQTGKVVAPDLYLAVGISGAIQHLAGMKDSKVIVAINKDEEAPIFQVADYGLVADLFDALPELSAALDS
ncbi:MAG: electron transfer flavoprotein subunit alpha/FixB family protein [Granulosicoccus sp.]